MRVPTVEPRRRSRFRLRGWIIGIVVVLVVLLFSLRGLAGFYTDFLWFDSLGQGSTWSSLLAARVAPALVFTVVFVVIMFVNLVIADRLVSAGRGSLHDAHPHRRVAVLRVDRRDRCVVAVEAVGALHPLPELRPRRSAVPQGHRLLRLPAAVPEVHRRVALRRARDRADRHRGRALPQRW